MRRMIVHFDCYDWIVKRGREGAALDFLLTMKRVKEEGPYSARMYLPQPDAKDCPHTIEIKLVDPSRIQLAISEQEAALVREAEAAASKERTAKWTAEAEAGKLKKELDAIKAAIGEPKPTAPGALP